MSALNCLIGDKNFGNGANVIRENINVMNFTEFQCFRIGYILRGHEIFGGNFPGHEFFLGNLQGHENILASFPGHEIFLATFPAHEIYFVFLKIPSGPG